MDDAPQDDWLQAARMEALEAEVRRLQTIEDALLTSEAKTGRYKAELGQVRADAGILEQQLADSQAEVARLRMTNRSGRALSDALNVWNDQLEDENKRLKALLGAFVADDAAGHIEHEDGYMECQYCDGQGTYDWTSKTYTYAHTADCLVTRARALLTPPAAPEADTSAPVTD